MTEPDMIERIVSIEGRSKSNAKRITDLEQRQLALEQLTASVKILADRQERTESDITEIKCDVKRLLLAPGSRWVKVVEYIMLATIGIIVTVIAAKVGLT